MRERESDRRPAVQTALRATPDEMWVQYFSILVLLWLHDGLDRS